MSQSTTNPKSEPQQDQQVLPQRRTIPAEPMRQFRKISGDEKSAVAQPKKNVSRPQPENPASPKTGTLSPRAEALSHLDPDKGPAAFAKRAKPLAEDLESEGDEERGTFNRLRTWFSDGPGTRYAIRASVVVLGLYGIFSWGAAVGRSEAKKETAGPATRVLPVTDGKEAGEILATLDKSLKLAHSGSADKGWELIRGLSTRYPQTPSLAYAEALIALEAGENLEAGNLAKTSIARGERVSESLLILAALESWSETASTSKQEEILEQAIQADPMSPYPLVQLALLHSEHGDDALAAHLFESARTRLFPVDSHAVIDTSLAIFKLKNTPPSDLPANEVTPTGVAEKDIPTAYAAMRRGDFQSAARLLAASQKTASPDLFDYLLQSPPLREYALRPEILPFY
ncbi:MAG: tetratricopeptide repeat protein [Terrimicrobiaceae bacterium]